MKFIVYVLWILVLFSCKDAQLKEVKSIVEESEQETEMTPRKFPERLSKILEAHGGLKSWKAKRTLAFEIPKDDAKEVHTTDLHSRKDKIEIAELSMGFDGKIVWLDDKNDNYKGNATAYHNLMFYFFAMPFVLADEGIRYDIAKDLVFEGKAYPGIHISYNDGVGASSKDDYYLHYDSETNRMAWLGYTYTFGSDKKSDDVIYIKYSEWMNVNGIVLPKSITWHVVEGGMIKDARNTVAFENVVLSETSKPDTFYAKPENAKVVIKP